MTYDVNNCIMSDEHRNKALFEAFEKSTLIENNIKNNILTEESEESEENTDLNSLQTQEGFYEFLALSNMIELFKAEEEDDDDNNNNNSDDHKQKNDKKHKKETNNKNKPIKFSKKPQKQLIVETFQRLNIALIEAIQNCNKPQEILKIKQNFLNSLSPIYRNLEFIKGDKKIKFSDFFEKSFDNIYRYFQKVYDLEGNFKNIKAKHAIPQEKALRAINDYKSLNLYLMSENSAGVVPDILERISALKTGEIEDEIFNKCVERIMEQVDNMYKETERNDIDIIGETKNLFLTSIVIAFPPLIVFASLAYVFHANADKSVIGSFTKTIVDGYEKIKEEGINKTILDTNKECFDRRRKLNKEKIEEYKEAKEKYLKKQYQSVSDLDPSLSTLTKMSINDQRHIKKHSIDCIYNKIDVDLNEKLSNGNHQSKQNQNNHTIGINM